MLRRSSSMTALEARKQLLLISLRVQRQEVHQELHALRLCCEAITHQFHEKLVAAGSMASAGAAAWAAFGALRKLRSTPRKSTTFLSKVTSAARVAVSLWWAFRSQSSRPAANGYSRNSTLP